MEMDEFRKKLLIKNYSVIIRRIKCAVSSYWPLNCFKKLSIAVGSA